MVLFKTIPTIVFRICWHIVKKKAAVLKKSILSQILQLKQNLLTDASKQKGTRYVFCIFTKNLLLFIFMEHLLYVCKSHMFLMSHMCTPTNISHVQIRQYIPITYLWTFQIRRSLFFFFYCVSPFSVGRHIVFSQASVCLSHSCLLYNLKTVQAIITKFHININQH